jgi:sugar phosphate isomerase/epimerase
MKINQVAAQLYTVRDHLKTPSDIATSMKKVREIGYTAVQISGLGPIEDPELMKILDGEGLDCCATHEPSDVIRQTPEIVVERLNKLSCKYTAYPHPSGVDFSNPDDVGSLASDLDRAGAVLREAGQVLGYHNHAIEFLRVDGKTLLETIYDTTSAENLVGEIDTYWVQYGGGDPVAWCEKLAGRLPLIHLKDYAFSPENKPVFAEIGYGNLDFKRIVSAAETSGCEWYIIEQDTCPGDPFDSLKMSFDYIRDHLTEG